MYSGSEAFLAIWHDIDPAMAAEWHRWHSQEHMPERVAIPGFLAGRRYMNPAAPRHACFTLYEGRDLAVFASPAYHERLNAPTLWTRSMAPAFRNFMRGACRRVASAGREQSCGGALLTLRLERMVAPGPDPAGDGSIRGKDRGRGLSPVLVEGFAVVFRFLSYTETACAPDGNRRVRRPASRARQLRSVVAAVCLHERAYGRRVAPRLVVRAVAGTVHTDDVRSVAAARAAGVDVMVEARAALTAAAVGLMPNRIRACVILAGARNIAPNPDIAVSARVAAGAGPRVAAQVCGSGFDTARRCREIAQPTDR